MLRNAGGARATTTNAGTNSPSNPPGTKPESSGPMADQSKGKQITDRHRQSEPPARVARRAGRMDPRRYPVAAPPGSQSRNYSAPTGTFRPLRRRIFFYAAAPLCANCARPAVCGQHGADVLRRQRPPCWSGSWRTEGTIATLAERPAFTFTRSRALRRRGAPTMRSVVVSPADPSGCRLSLVGRREVRLDRSVAAVLVMSGMVVDRFCSGAEQSLPPAPRRLLRLEPGAVAAVRVHACWSLAAGRFGPRELWL